MKVEESHKQERKEEVKQENNAVYVGDLPITVTEKELYELFSKAGSIQTLSVHRKSKSFGGVKCFAYVTFTHPESVGQAVDAYNFHVINGSQIRVMKTMNAEALEKSKESNIIIKNLPKDTDNQSLYDTFSVCGKILSCKVQRNTSGECSGVGFIQFENPAVAKAAINLINRSVVDNKKLVAVQWLPNARRVNKKENINKVFTNVYMKNYPADTTEEELKEQLEVFGALTSFFFPRSPDGAPRGYAFANFRDHEDAVRAINQMHDKPFRGKEAEVPFYIQRAQTRAEREEELMAKYNAHGESPDTTYLQTIYVTNLPAEADEQEILSHFSGFGKILAHKIDKNPAVGRAFANIKYETHGQARKAIEEGNGGLFRDLPLSVALFKGKKVRELEKASQVYNSHGGVGEYPAHKRKSAAALAAESAEHTLYTLVLTLAPSYTDKILQAGFRADEDFARKIASMLLDLEEQDLRRAMSLGNVLSQYVEMSLEEIIERRNSANTTPVDPQPENRLAAPESEAPQMEHEEREREHEEDVLDIQDR